MLAVGAHRQHCSHPEKATAGRTRRQFYLSELVTRNAVEPVILSQHAVGHHKVALEQVFQAEVFPNEQADCLEDLLLGDRLGGKIKIGIELVVELEEIEPVEAEPLVGESGHKLARPCVGKHPVHLGRAARRLLQIPRPRRLEQGVVRRTAPEEVRKTRCQFEIVERPTCLLRVLLPDRFRQIEEVRRGEHDRERLLHRRAEWLSCIPVLFEDRHEPVEILLRGLPAAEGTRGKPFQHAADVLLGRGFSCAGRVCGGHSEQFGQCRWSEPISVQRSLGLDPIDPDGKGRTDSILAMGIEEKFMGLFIGVVNSLFVDPESADTVGRNTDRDFQDLG